MVLEAAMTDARRFPALLMATRALSARTERVLPKTAMKNRLPVSSLEVLIDSFGTIKSKLMFFRARRWVSQRLTGSKICDVCKEVEDEYDCERQWGVSLHCFDGILRNKNERLESENNVCVLLPLSRS